MMRSDRVVVGVFPFSKYRSLRALVLESGGSARGVSSRSRSCELERMRSFLRSLVTERWFVG